MAYTPTPGIFVDGEIIDADDFTTEFALISTGLADDFNTLNQQDADNLATAQQYTDDAIADLVVDGGTF